MKAERTALLLPVAIMASAVFGLSSIGAADEVNGPAVAAGQHLGAFYLPVSRTVTPGDASVQSAAIALSAASDNISALPGRNSAENLTLEDDSRESTHYAALAMPEPAPLALLGVGVLGLSVARRRTD